MVSLVPLMAEDGGALEEIHASCFPDAWDRATFDNLLKENPTCGWMATSLTGDPLGFILARIVGNEAEILTFAVQPSSQKLGVGRCLLKALMNFLTSVRCKKVFLEVAFDNETAIGLYRSAGFKPVGTRPNYYQRTGQTFVSASVMAWTADEME
ncbi:MAG: ribosomal-protein-alanine N-acetyltransferase [Alphaproteobacteria bacterium]|jgi:ribosomal-protein-alanine N-acetyltransferase|nr:ribosomal-protein-alanine N-acetyltransferase [Alphaproteobacteria bacterium]